MAEPNEKAQPAQPVGDEEVDKKDVPVYAGRPAAMGKRGFTELFEYLVKNKLLDTSGDNSKAIADIQKLIIDLEKNLRTNCDMCLAEREAKGEFDDSAQTGPKLPPEAARRSKFLLRLLAGKFSHLFKIAEGQKTAFLPHEIVHAFDDYLRLLLGNLLYKELNSEAQVLLSQIQHDDDDLIWKEVRSVEQARRFALNILLRILLRFVEFDKAKANFIRIVNNSLQENLKKKFEFNETHFTVLFEALFREVFQSLLSDTEEIKFDYLFGDGTSDKIRDIQKTFKELQKKHSKKLFDFDD